MILNSSGKKLNAINKNYFFITTVIIVIINIIVFSISRGEYIYFEHVDTSTDLTALIIGLVNSYNHINLQHILLNMLCFVITGIFIERKVGSYCFSL